MARVRIGLTLGDPNGIGPEIILKSAPHWPTHADFTVIGCRRILEEQAQRLGLPCTVAIDDPGLDCDWNPGRVEARAGAAAGGWVRHAAMRAGAGTLDAVVTAPISKEALQLGGYAFPGHTEFLAHLADTKRFAMMLVGGPLRVTLATCHIPLSDVPAAITSTRLREVIALTSEALPWLGLGGRIAVCGLNPHAGENGTMGREEQEIITPVLDRLREAGLPVDGPLPGDTVFHRAAKGEFSAVVAMYHDQGLAPLKLIAFDEGVNLTLGLPYVRTSPDHGTAFGIAGRGVANPSSLIAAIRLAAALAGKPNPWRTR